VSPNVPGAPRGKAQNKRPACALSAIFWRVGPSTRGATAPQRAQQVNFVVCRNAYGERFGYISDMSDISCVLNLRMYKMNESIGNFAWAVSLSSARAINVISESVTLN
jgi:hypothetical protein